MLLIGGENLIDFVSGDVSENGLPTYIAYPGGSPFNVAISAARQGQKVLYLTPISNDALGNLITTHLVESGVKIAAPKVDAPTSLAIVSLREGIPSYSFHRNGTAERQISMPKLTSYTPQDAQVFHIGSLGLIDGEDADIWEEYFCISKKRGLLTSLDPNVRPILINNRQAYLDRIFRMMRYADILKMSDEDLMWLYPDRALTNAISNCISDSNAVLLILTLGSKGSLGFTRDIEITIPARTVSNLCDTVGAGDTFMATILVNLIEMGYVNREKLSSIEETELRNSMSLASVAAAINCERSGCNPPLRSELILDKQKY
jgi:fructokinase